MYSRDHTLSPLPTVLRHGLKAVVVLSFLSLVTSLALYLYLSGRLAVWYFRTAPRSPERTIEAGDGAGLPHEIGVQYFGPGRRAKGRQAPNQALILVLNVLFADVLQACAFFLNIVWLVEDRISDQSPACWAQGWFISTGDLASTTFIATIAVHTYITLVRGYKISTKIFYGVISFLWFFVLLMSVLGVMITNNGKDTGGFYVRDVSWCWITPEEEAMRIYLHYLWMLLLIITGTISYVLVFIHVHRRDRALKSSKKAGEESSSNNSVLSPTSMTSPATEDIKSEVHKRMLFLLYPLIFLICTAPLALGRILGSSGVKLSPEYLCFAGAMITSNGWLDVLVFSTTRRAILFDAPPDEQNLGLETFNLTPLGQQFGHRVWITSGASKRAERKPSVFRKPSRCRTRGSDGCHDRSESQTSLNSGDVDGMKGIQMETVTRVFIEVEAPAVRRGFSARTLSSMPSVETVGERVPQSMDSIR